MSADVVYLHTADPAELLRKAFFDSNGFEAAEAYIDHALAAIEHYKSEAVTANHNTRESQS